MRQSETTRSANLRGSRRQRLSAVQFLSIELHWLPADTNEGDWVEAGMMGAYFNSLKTGFNGFASGTLATLSDGGWYLGGRLWEREPATLAA